MKWIEQCTLCESSELALLWDLPQLPLSETFGKYDPDFLSYDQQLVICDQCGHVQLKCQLAPEVMYNQDDYHYKTANSGATQRRFACLHQFIQTHLTKRPEVVVDIGGNDASLVNVFDCPVKYVVDPSISESGLIDGVQFIKGFAESVDFSALQADVVVFSHVLEHMVSPKAFISQLFSSCDDTTVFALEVPCFDRQIEALRFDAFFHQHLHYFHAQSLRYVIESGGGEIIAMEPSSVPTCGGALMVVFKKNAQKTAVKHTDTDITATRKAVFGKQLAVFKQRNQAISTWLGLQKKVYGYGASLLLPVIFYHIPNVSDAIQVILDDDPGKDGLTYKNLPGITVSLPAHQSLSSETAMLVTSYENIGVLQNVIKVRFGANLFEGF
ncbi:class I SAM-dependent methyltransferase [Alteromonas lipolytica]|uniref:Methyltransferase putative zinc binding domain-containing protein n=1 Tax=Alteromonas lipolytica TaxID=1856405 RepID=A0A1E8FFB4_9ALTE|nr:methyltransferase domain-containing protein [Alteromonas lipolytica]OFI34600.1 hypothetical protein BFC17_13455 [Alteromonas lipolytica]GGF52408.1 SAM-dependent methyltransferase [Alteromonas lipolytica]